MVYLIEVKSRELVNKSDRDSKDRARNLRVRLEFLKDGESVFSVNSQSTAREYRVRIASDSILEGMSIPDLKKILQTEDVKVFCYCPAFLYRGYKYINFRNGSGLEPEGRPPYKNNPNKAGMLCKHILAVFRYLGIY